MTLVSKIYIPFFSTSIHFFLFYDENFLKRFQENISGVIIIKNKLTERQKKSSDNKKKII